MNENGKRITNKLIEIHGSKDFSIAFLPYKRSMWNSMESVYEECKAAGAKAYLVPIPYFEVKDGETVRLKCDRQYFSGANRLSFLETNTFDFVVIHYPYDDHNKVTRLPESFHIQNLRKYGKIIYIPYSCTNMRQLRVQPGIANVDYAFLGSEAEAEAFIGEWKEYGVDFTGKVFGFGSPKMDAAQKLSSGSATVILNSLGPFLTNPFGKMKQYSDIMLEETTKGKEVIFRPHPLLRQTIESMRPDTEKEYLSLLSFAGHVGVEVDESEDLEKTLGRADYLISDPSSVLEMWASTGRRYQVI